MYKSSFDTFWPVYLFYLSIFSGSIFVCCFVLKCIATITSIYHFSYPVRIASHIYSSWNVICLLFVWIPTQKLYSHGTNCCFLEKTENTQTTLWNPCQWNIVTSKTWLFSQGLSAVVLGHRQVLKPNNARKYFQPPEKLILLSLF